MAFDLGSIIGGAAGQGLKGLLEGVGSLAKDLRQAITGKDPQAEAKLLEIEQQLTLATVAVSLAEAQSQDKWTSRARPFFLYVVYIFILAAIPMGFMFALKPMAAKQVAEGVKLWLDAIPTDVWMLFGTGYLGYGAFRSYDKAKVIKNGK